jgi:hypothetical protein
VAGFVRLAEHEAEIILVARSDILPLGKARAAVPLDLDPAVLQQRVQA